jgi:tetratricopeptide (TPR) repeat protein
MTLLRTYHRVAIALFLGLTSVPTAALAQDALTKAKGYYASASYEEALQVLESLNGKAPATEATEVAAYQVFCLMALGRSDEARHAIEAIVRTDPLYRPSDAQASPRVRTFFADVRRPLLPEVVRQSYAKAKGAFDRKEMPAATAEFDQVLALLDELGSSADQGTADLRTLATGFRELSKAATPPPPPPPPPEPVTPPPAAVPAPPPAPVIYSVANAGVTRPVAVSQPLPEWHPEGPVEAKLDFNGTLELVIGEDGKVLSAVLTKSIHPRYDPVLLKAVQTWTFRPAMKDGQAVRFRYALAVHLGK